MSDEVVFPAEIAKVQTLADGAIRVTLDLPEGMELQAAQLMQYKRYGVVGTVTFEPVENGCDTEKYRKMHI